jgi:putative heme-binding domain-containing protein
VGEAPLDSKPLSPLESLRAFHAPDDLEIDQVLAEPIVAQPVFLNFDERGRMWVVQYLQYPDPAGLKAVSHDSSWRTVYDKVPPPPPHHFPGRDKITIHESTRHDGVFDQAKTFVEGLNITTAVERGRGGVWVLNPPYLLFYPDANHDDVPDGDPVVHLAGFGLEDTHSVTNSLRWGPDGWLYGAQGSTVSGHVLRPGIDQEPISNTLGQHIWRYHPETRRFEVFSEGGGNPFGIELDAKGRIFSGHNGGNTRGFYYMQGAYLQKGFDKHGPLSNPYAFGYFPPMYNPAVERFSHSFVIYDGGALPEHYVGKLFGIEPLQGRVVESEITPDKSSFRTRDITHVITSRDSWFRPVENKVGPDGAIYIGDWYDRNVEHVLVQDGRIDRSDGRIYRVKARGAKPPPPFDLGKLSSPQLIELLGHSNKWFRQTALRVIGDRRDKTIIPALTELILQGTGQRALEALWALHLSGGLTEATALKTLEHSDPFVRLWTARLLCDDNRVPPLIAEKLVRMAQTESNLEARAQLACSARRLPAKYDLAIVRQLLAHDEDAGDDRLPLLLWWAIESKAESDRDEVAALFSDTTLWSRPIVRQHLLGRLMRRYAQAGTRRDLLTCAALFALSPSPADSQALMTGFEAAFQGRALTSMPEELLVAMARFDAGSVALDLRQSKPPAVAQALQTIADDNAKETTRAQYIGILGEVRIPAGIPVLLSVLEKSRSATLQQAALSALQSYDDPRIGERVVALYHQFGRDTLPAVQTLLASRAAWSRQWLQAINAGQIKADTVSPNIIRAIKLHPDPAVVQLADKAWGQRGRPTTAEMEKQIQRLATVVRGGTGEPYAGRTLFQNFCAGCHTYFGQGGQVGPDLTPYKRDDLDTLLRNIVNPSASIREGYEYNVIETKDGRSLSGFLVEQNNQFIVVRGLDGQNITLDRQGLLKLESAGLSLMPEGLLDALNDQQARDLFAYLRCSQPLVGGPAASRAEELRR